MEAMLLATNSIAILYLVGVGLNGSPVAGDSPCLPRWSDDGQGYVCVCNSTYCDTVEFPEPLHYTSYHLYKTSNSTPGFSKSTGKFNTGSFEAVDEVVFTIQSAVEYQEIIGFGAAVTDSSCINKNTLPEKAQENLMKSYFGASGIEYNMLRVPIGSSDFGNRSYTYDDYPNDVNLVNFSLAEEDYSLKIPFLKEAINMSQRDIKLMACPWSAPAWMRSKSNGPTYVKDIVLDVWAKYYVRFLEEYQKKNLSFWSISGSNEGMLLIMLPALGSSTTIVVYAHAQRSWLKNNLQPLLDASNFSDVMFLAMEDQNIFTKYWLDSFALDKEAYAAVGGVAMHWYADYFAPTAETLDEIHQAHPDKLILHTEASCNGVCGQEAVVLGSWYRAETYLYDIMLNLNHWSSSFMDWNLALNPSGGPTLSFGIEAPIIVDETSGEFYKQPMFYAIGHYSKFIQPGARRVHVDVGPSVASVDDKVPSKPSVLSNGKLEDSRLQAPYKKVIEVPQSVDCLAASNPDGSFTAIVTNTKNVTVNVRIEDSRVGSISLRAEEHSINTFVYWPKKTAA